MFALVFPAESAAVPDVAPSLAAAGFAGAAFKTCKTRRRGRPQRDLVGPKRPQRSRKSLASATFREIGLLPFSDEFLASHARRSPHLDEVTRTDRDVLDYSPEGAGVLASPGRARVDPAIGPAPLYSLQRPFTAQR